MEHGHAVCYNPGIAALSDGFYANLVAPHSYNSNGGFSIISFKQRTQRKFEMYLVGTGFIYQVPLDIIRIL
jgi:hypothetical protein